MPDRRRHRGPHPKDEACFDGSTLPILRTAVAELSWLLSRGYTKKASLALVGDRHRLRDRQRKAVQRCAASDEHCRARSALEVRPSALRGRTLYVDGYNVLLTLETALSGGAVLRGRDGALRDLAAMSRHYRRVATTRPALELVAGIAARLGTRDVHWYLDRPISNSGRLAAMMRGMAEESSWPWTVDVVADPDGALIESGGIVASSDSIVMERSAGWCNVTQRILEERIPEAWVLDLGSPPTLHSGGPARRAPLGEKASV